jgi:riboflavin transporter FmnP
MLTHMNTKALAVIIVFAALTVVLNPALSGIGIPAPYAPYLVYQIWEIPIVAVFLLYGSKYGIAISTVNAFVLLAIFVGPGGLPAAPFYNLAAILSMMLGVYLPHKIAALKNKNPNPEKPSSNYSPAMITASTALGVTLRVAIMTVVNYVVLRYSYPVGYSMAEPIILASLPLIALFNATLALYTVPLGHAVAAAVKRNLKL